MDAFFASFFIDSRSRSIKNITLCTRKIKKYKLSPSGNRTPVSRVTGGDTYHYTNEDLAGRLGAAMNMMPTFNAIQYNQ